MGWNIFKKKGQQRQPPSEVENPGTQTQQQQATQTQEAAQGKLGATPTKVEKSKKVESNLPPYLTQGIITQEPELKGEIEEYLTAYQNNLKNLKREEFVSLIDNIYKYSQKAEANTSRELYNLILKLLEIRSDRDRNDVINALEDKTLKNALQEAKILKLDKLTNDDLIKVLSLRIGNESQKIDNLLTNNNLRDVALLLELKNRGFNVENHLTNLYETRDKQLSNVSRLFDEGKNVDEAILTSVRNRLTNDEKEIFDSDSLKGNSLAEKIENAKKRLNELKNRWEVPTESEAKELKLLPNIINKLEEESKQINRENLVALYHLNNAIKEISDREIARFYEPLELNRPFGIKDFFTKRFTRRRLVGGGLVAGAVGGSYLFSHFLGPTENTLTNMLIFGPGIGGVELAGYKVWSAGKKLLETPGLRAKFRTAKGDIAWAAVGGLTIYAAYRAFGYAKDEREKKIWGEFLKDIGLSKDGKTLDENAVKELLGVTSKQLEQLIDFYSTENGKQTLIYLSNMINKKIEVPKTFDIEKIKGGLDSDSLGAFVPNKWLPALFELQEEMKTSSVKNAVNKLLPTWKEKGYLFNSSQTILFEYGIVLGFSRDDLEKIVIDKDKAKNFADMIGEIYKGNLPQCLATKYYELKYKQGNEAEAEKLKYAESIKKGSLMELYDRYTLFILQDPSKSDEEKERALENFKNTLMAYNASDEIRNRLSQITQNIVYGDVHGYITDKINDITTNAAFYYEADPILARIDKRFLDDPNLVKFAVENGIVDWAKNKKNNIEDNIEDNKIGVTNFYDFVKKELYKDKDKVFKSLEQKDRAKWLNEQLKKGIYKKYKGSTELMPATYNTFGIEIAPGLSKETGTTGETQRSGGRAPTTAPTREEKPKKEKPQKKSPVRKPAKPTGQPNKEQKKPEGGGVGEL